MIDVLPADLEIVLHILKHYAPDHEARAFGSRRTHKAKKYSDLDLVLVGEVRLDWRQMAKIKEAFEESTLPYRVDVLDWNAISPEFKKVIEEHGFEVIRKRRAVKRKKQPA